MNNEKIIKQTYEYVINELETYKRMDMEYGTDNQNEISALMTISIFVFIAMKNKDKVVTLFNNLKEHLGSIRHWQTLTTGDEDVIALLEARELETIYILDIIKEFVYRDALEIQ